MEPRCPDDDDDDDDGGDEDGDDVHMNASVDHATTASSRWPRIAFKSLALLMARFLARRNLLRCLSGAKDGKEGSMEGGIGDRSRNGEPK